MTRMSTWQDFSGDAGKADTLWTFDPQRGFMTTKTYADANSVQYAYTPGGKLKSRIWARGVETHYHFGMAGDLVSVRYSDTNTPPVLNTFDRLGRIVAVEDGTGRRILTYTNTGAVVEERYETGPLAGTVLKRGFDSLGRLSSVTPVLAPTNLSAMGVAYTYDGASRLATAAYGSNSETWSYSPGKITNAVWQGTTKVYVKTRAWDSLERLTSIESVALAGGTNSFRLGYTYGYNAANQRTNCALSDGTQWGYGYDSLGQVTNGSKKTADGAALAGHSFGYQFDDIGNRKSSARDGTAADYTANLLNQYVERTVPGQVVVLGQAATNVGMLVNGVTAQRQSQSFYKAFTVDNATGAVYSSVEVKGMTSSQTNQTSGHRFTAKTPEAFAYDLDGNLLQDGRWDYTWDAENRLIGMEARTNLSVATPRQRLVFTYDSQSRRITKTAYTYESEIWNQKSQIRFAYDAWNLVSEICYLPTQQRTRASTYVWGSDLSGTFQGAGGIGGLLASYTSTLNVSHLSFYAFDGNGNVMALIDSGTLQPVAQYEYSPFGEVIRACGPQAKVNPFQFSTKYCDAETGLDYYGYRYLNPETGRWLSKDPIGEDGGKNLYTFAHNDAVGLSDVLGLWTSSLHDGLTKIAASTYFATAASGDIGKYDNAVDSDFPPTSLYLVNQQYHFNTTYGTGSDSRNTISASHIQKAKDFCDKRLHNDNYAESVKNFGYSIHPIQDITAHGDYPGWVGIVPHLHNVSGPHLDGAPGSPSDYPDNYNLDAVEGLNGIPSGSAVRSSNKAKFEFGVKRFLKARADTHAMLTAFETFIKRYGSCNCKKSYLSGP